MDSLAKRGSGLGERKGISDSVVMANPSSPKKLVFLSTDRYFILRQSHNGGNYSATRRRCRCNFPLLGASVCRQAQNANDMIAFIKSSFYDCIISVIKTFTNIFY